MADTRPDPSINSSDLYVLKDNENVSSATYGHLVKVCAVIYNSGSSDVSDVTVRLGIRSVNSSQYPYNSTIIETPASISSGAPLNFQNVNYSWYVTLMDYQYNYEIWALIDPDNFLDEQNESNNFATIPFAIDPFALGLTISTDKAEYDAGDSLFYFANATYYLTAIPVPSITGLVFYILDLETNEEVPSTRTLPQTADPQGRIIGMIFLPSDLSSGRYQVVAEFRGSLYSGESPMAIEIDGPPSTMDKLLIPVLVIALSVAVVAVVAYYVVRKPKT